MNQELNVLEILTEVKAQDDESASKYLEVEHRDFSLYTISQRAIPIFNGLKPVQQRCLWQLRGVSKYEKVAKLTGMVMSIHPHGDASISEAINQMAGPYCNNVPWLDGHGAFGTRINPTAFGSPRYVSAKFNSFGKEVIFKDWEIVPLKPSYDETDVEPAMLLPLIPLVLLNGVQGIATGYSTVILPRSLKDLVDRQIKVLKGQKIDNPLPYSKPIDNIAIRDENNPNKYTFLGECEVIDTSKAKITKLPYGMTHAKIVESLAKMVDKGLIVDYTDKSKADVNIIVDFKRAALKNKTGEFVARKLKLSAGATERIIVLDAKTSSSVHEYHDAALFISDYTNWRLTFFPTRYKRLIQLNLADISRLNDVIISIDNDLGGQAKSIKNKADLISFIENIGVKDIDYISSLPVYRFTKEEYDKAKAKISELEAENRDYADIIGDVERQKLIYISELQEVKRKFGK
jgi:DNA gyrase subunit A